MEQKNYRHFKIKHISKNSTVFSINRPNATKKTTGRSLEELLGAISPGLLNNSHFGGFVAVDSVFPLGGPKGALLALFGAPRLSVGGPMSAHGANILEAKRKKI